MSKTIPPAATRYKLIRDSILPIQQKWLLEVLNRYQGANDTCWVRQETLARDCSYSDTRQVRRLLTDLFRLGIVSITSPNGANHCNHYSINEPALIRLQQRTLPPADTEDPFDRTRKTAQADTEVRPLRRTQKTAGKPLTRSVKTPTKTEDGGRDDLRSGEGGGGDSPGYSSSPNPAREGNAFSGSRTRAAPDSGSPDSGWDNNAQLSDFIKYLPSEEVYAKVELIRLSENDNPMVRSTRDPNSVAAGHVTLMKEIETERGRHPDPWEIADATNDQVFRGLKQLSWGLLVSRKVLKTGRSAREEFKYQIVRRMRDKDYCTSPLGQNSADAHHRRIEEMKRDAALSGDNPSRPSGLWSDTVESGHNHLSGPFLEANPIRRNHRLETLLELKRLNPDDPELDQLIREVQEETAEE